jgi:hypothetical protein
MFEDEDSLPLRPEAADVEGAATRNPAPAGAPPSATGRRRAIRGLVIFIFVALAVYYPAGMMLAHQINDNPDFSPAATDAPAGGSAAVAMTAALLKREVDDAGWVANNPFFYPSWALDNMPNFQQGLRAAIFRFAIELTDQIGRTRGSSQADEDLETAAGEFKFPGDIWVWDPETSWLPQATSEARYRRGIEHLERYNARLAAGDAVFDTRADNLLNTLDRFAADLGSASAEIDQHVKDHTGFIDLDADDLFYNVKGRLYGYFMILSQLEHDFANVIAERQLEAVWANMLASLRTAATVDPWVVVNGAPDSQILPSHLVAQGFYLLRGRTQLREITNILLK